MVSVWILNGFKLIVLNCNFTCNVEDEYLKQVDDKGACCSSPSVGNGATNVATGNVSEATSSSADISGKGSALPPINANKNPNRALGTRPSSEQPIPNSDNSVVPITQPSSSSALSSSSSDPSSEAQLPGSVDAIKNNGGSLLHPNEPSTANLVENKLILGQHRTTGFFLLLLLISFDVWLN